MAGVESGVHGGQNAAVEGLGAVQKSHILRRAEVVVRADLGFCAIARTLQPSTVLTSCAGRDCLHGDELESVEWSSHDGAIAQCLRSECSANRRIEAL